MKSILRLLPTAAFFSIAVTAALQPPQVTKSFSPAVIPINGTTTATFTVTNPNGVTTLTGVNFNDVFPAGMVGVVATLGGFCTGGSTGSVSFLAASTTTPFIGFVNGFLLPGGSCTFTIDVIVSALGVLVNSVTVQDTTAGTGNTATATVRTFAPGDAFMVRYVANLNVTDALINVTNTGLNGAMPFGPGIGPQAGNICVNVYAFSPDEQMVGCCSCHITPNGLASISVYNDIRAITLTGLTPNSMMIKLVATGTGVNSFTGGASSCSQSAAGLQTTHSLAGGMAAWATTGHVPGAFPVPGAPAPFAITETAFTGATLSAAEVTSLNNRCTAIIGNGSTFGTCRSCTLGGRGADRQ